MTDILKQRLNDIAEEHMAVRKLLTEFISDRTRELYIDKLNKLELDYEKNLKGMQNEK